MKRHERTKLLITVALTAMLFACDCRSHTEDAGVAPDGSADEEVSDAGEIQAAGGCYGDRGQKFILYFESTKFCGAVSFRSRDAGSTPLFEGQVVAPNGFVVDEARIGLCSMRYEQLDGRLNQAALPMEDFAATITWFIQAGRPLAYDAFGSLAVSNARYWFATPPEGTGLVDTCVGP